MGEDEEEEDDYEEDDQEKFVLKSENKVKIKIWLCSIQFFFFSCVFKFNSCKIWTDNVTFSP